MGFNKSWPISLRYGDYKYCGLQLKHLLTEALIRTIYHLHILLFKPNTSQLVLAMLAWYQHVLVISYPVLEHRPFTMNHINSLWFNDFVRLLKKYNMELKLQDTFVTKFQRQNNCHTMNDILTTITSTTSRKTLLACSLYFQVTLLSDILDIKGTSLVNNVLIGRRSKYRHHNSSRPLPKT